jgi:hypothetical protein
MEPETLFTYINELRDGTASVTTGSLVAPSTGNSVADEALSALAAATARLPGAMATQFEVLAKSFTVAGIDVIVADRIAEGD